MGECDFFLREKRGQRDEKNRWSGVAKINLCGERKEGVNGREEEGRLSA